MASKRKHEAGNDEDFPFPRADDLSNHIASNELTQLVSYAPNYDLYRGFTNYGPAQFPISPVVPTNAPVPTNVGDNCLLTELTECVSNKKLDLLKAGRIIQYASLRGHINSDIIKKFASAHCNVNEFIVTTPVDYNNPQIIATLLASNVVKDAIMLKKNEELMREVTLTKKIKSNSTLSVKGSRKNVKTIHMIPAFGPFKNFAISLDDHPMPPSDSPHLILQHHLKHILRKICSVPSSIQRYSLGRTTKSTKLPDVIYEPLKKYFFEFINLNNEELEGPSPTLEEFSESPFLKSLGLNSNERVSKFRALSSARISFDSVFDGQLSIALSEMRYGSFDKDGNFYPRSRKSTASEIARPTPPETPSS
ncbi:unnamed protein product [Caenorhabditis bovis]|uniref:Uncharacterized protein n=1 Tax=Caenorhabditis bovis TaxID=2654633 RepID=A0A8S1EN75_9PELO|nr:unnamed protein product [Caenorhabditis bovis]